MLLCDPDTYDTVYTKYSKYVYCTLFVLMDGWLEGYVYVDVYVVYCVGTPLCVITDALFPVLMALEWRLGVAVALIRRLNLSFSLVVF